MSVCLSASLFPYHFPSLVVGKADNPQEAEVGAEPVSLLSIAALSCLCALDKGMDWLSSQGLIHLQLLPGAAQKMWVGWDHPSGCCCSAYSSLGDVCVCLCIHTHICVCVHLYTHLCVCIRFVLAHSDSLDAFSGQTEGTETISNKKSLSNYGNKQDQSCKGMP